MKRKVDQVIEILRHEVETHGQSHSVIVEDKTKRVFEIFGTSYTLSNAYDTDDYFESVNREYVNNKLIELEDQISDCITVLEKDSTSRRALIHFSQDLPNPSCCVSIQIQLRLNRVYVHIHQRSQDVDMLKTDMVMYVEIVKLFTARFARTQFTIRCMMGNLHRYDS